MKITQSFNQNAVSVTDPNGKELVLIGKGIGFGKKRGDTIDVENASKIFRFDYTKAEKKMIDSIKDVSEEVILITEEILTKSSQFLKEELDTTFLFSLAAHIQFALDNPRNDMPINPFGVELKYIYPSEYKVAKWAVEHINANYGLDLPMSEISFFTLHFVNGLKSSRNIDNVVKLSDILMSVAEVVENSKELNIDKESIVYSRFILHVRYFLIRILSNETKVNQSDEEMKKLYTYLKVKFEDASKILEEIINVLVEEYELEYDESENFYLLIHIQRLTDNFKI